MQVGRVPLLLIAIGSMAQSPAGQRLEENQGKAAALKKLGPVFAVQANTADDGLAP